MSREVSPERQGMYALGMILTIGGVVIFVGSMISAMNRSLGQGIPSPAPFLIGVGMIAAGNGIRVVAAKGLAGSGVILDPQRARKDLEPYSRMAGGMVSDALEEVEGIPAVPETVVKIRCRTCLRLNEEDSKFCQECGEKL